MLYLISVRLTRIKANYTNFWQTVIVCAQDKRNIKHALLENFNI